MGQRVGGLWAAGSIDGRHVLCGQISRWQWSAAPTRRLTLAKAGTITPDEARTLARKTLGSIAHGADPAAQRAADKRASTLAEVAEQFLTEHVEANGQRRPPDHIAICWSGWRCRNSASVRLTKLPGEIQRLHSKHAHTPYQANRLLRVLSSLFTFAGKAHVVPFGFNPCRGIEHFPEEGRERYLTTLELRRSAKRSGKPKRSDCLTRWINRNQGKHAPKEANRRTVIGPHAAAALTSTDIHWCPAAGNPAPQMGPVDFERGLLLLPPARPGRKPLY